jgi:hypothetical protein
MLGQNIPLKKDTYKPLITNIERKGFWILVNDVELFVPFDSYPDFENATLSQLFAFRSDENGQAFHWDELDVDIEIDALKYPERYPLLFRKMAS